MLGERKVRCFFYFFAGYFKIEIFNHEQKIVLQGFVNPGAH